MRLVGVIGAGQMGTGIAQTVAQFGMKVLLSDLDLAHAEAGKAKIDSALGKLVGRGKIAPEEAEAALGRITPVANYAPMAEAELIIEAATEKEEIKHRIFAEAGKVLGADAIMASNTSSIPITRMAVSSPDPARFIGFAFLTPVPGKRQHQRKPGAGLRVQPHPATEVQRGGLRARPGNRGYPGHRQGLPTRAQSPDGAARTRRFRRARYLPRYRQGALQHHR